MSNALELQQELFREHFHLQSYATSNYLVAVSVTGIDGVRLNGFQANYSVNTVNCYTVHSHLGSTSHCIGFVIYFDR